MSSIGEKIELPTSLAMARRPFYSPRPNPWVYFSVVGQRGERPYIAVLRPGIKTRDEFLAVFKQVFVEQTPEAALARYSSDVRAALRQKRLLRGMDGDAAKLAWGPPERIHQEYAGGIKLETWTWPLQKRSATFRDGWETGTAQGPFRGRRTVSREPFPSPTSANEPGPGPEPGFWRRLTPPLQRTSRSRIG